MFLAICDKNCSSKSIFYPITLDKEEEEENGRVKIFIYKIMTPEATQQPPTEQDFKIKTYNITRVVSVESENEQGDPITKTRVILKDPELGKLVVRFNKDLSKFFTDNPNAKIAIQGDFKEGSPVATISLPGNQNIPSKMLQTVGSD